MFKFIKRQLRRYDWKCFFRKNGTGEIVWKKIRWIEHPNDIACSVVVHGEISGGYRGPTGTGVFMASHTDDGLSELRTERQAAAESYFESYALPDCRCRLGRHWKCGIHGNWIG